jgi:hypothetical protein
MWIKIVTPVEGQINLQQKKNNIFLAKMHIVEK